MALYTKIFYVEIPVVEKNVGSIRRRMYCIELFLINMKERFSYFAVTKWRRQARSKSAWKKLLRQSELRHTVCLALSK